MSVIYYAMNEETAQAINEKRRTKYIIKIGESGNATRRAYEIHSRDNDLMIRTWEVDDSISYRRTIEAIMHLIIENNFDVVRKGNDHYIIKTKKELVRLEKSLDKIFKHAEKSAGVADVFNI